MWRKEWKKQVHIMGQIWSVGKGSWKTTWNGEFTFLMHWLRARNMGTICKWRTRKHSEHVQQMGTRTGQTPTYIAEEERDKARHERTIKYERNIWSSSTWLKERLDEIDNEPEDTMGNWKERDPGLSIHRAYKEEKKGRQRQRRTKARTKE